MAAVAVGQLLPIADCSCRRCTTKNGTTWPTAVEQRWSVIKGQHMAKFQCTWPQNARGKADDVVGKDNRQLPKQQQQQKQKQQQ